MNRTLLALSLLVLSVGWNAASAQVDEFHALILPRHGHVALNDVITVTFEVDASAQQFNGYELTMKFDPTIVSFEAVEEGVLMETCGNRFTFLATTDSTVTYTHVILCAGLALDGPGELSRYFFRGINFGISPTAAISDVDCTFFDAGECVAPDHPTFPRQVVIDDGEIHVFDPPIDVPPNGGVLDAGVRVQVTPNPTRGHAWLEIETSRDERVWAEILTADGRRVWTWPETSASGGSLRLAWPATTSSGRDLGAGVYFYRVRTQRQTRAGKILLLR